MQMKQRFTFSDTGTEDKTGPLVVGELTHMHWDRANAAADSDTGPTITVTVLPEQGDTGPGFDIFSEVLSASSTRSLRLPGDTGASYAPVTMAGDRLKVRRAKSAGDTGNTSGTLYVWSR